MPNSENAKSENSSNAVDVCNFVSVARAKLQPYLERIGLVIYSKSSTLAPNPVVFLGFNPGQNPSVIDPTHWTIGEALDKFPLQTKSLLWQVWPQAGRGTRQEGGVSVYKHHYEEGKAPYQKRGRHLLDSIGFQNAIVSNFLFLQTGNARAASRLEGISEIVMRCWEVHEAIFAIANPKVVITTSEVIRWMRKYELLALNGPIGEGCRAGYQNWRCERYLARLIHGEITVLQVPHMSFWACDTDNEVRRNAVQWVATAVRDAVRC